MKIAFSLLLLFLLGCNAQESRIKLNGSFIYYKPKKIKVLTYNPSVDDNTGRITKGGFLLKRNHLMGVGYKIFLDEKGRKTKRFWYRQGDTIPSSRETWEYLDGNKVLNINIPGAPPYTSNRLYSTKYLDTLIKDGKKLPLKAFFPRGTMDEKQVRTQYAYIYDENDVVTKEIIKRYERNVDSGYYGIESIDTVNYFTEYKDGNLHRYGKEAPYMVYEYYDDGSLKRETVETNEYNNYYFEYYPNGILKRYFEHEEFYRELDEDGKFKKKVQYNDVYTAEHKDYDQYGNWTKVIIYNNNIPVQYIEREITYYE